MKAETLKIRRIPALVWGKPSGCLYLYIHGKLGYKEEAKEFARIACRKGWQVLSFDLPGHGERKQEVDRFFPWYIISELESIWEYAARNWNTIALRATSIGAWFSMLSLAGKPLEKALFVSPILDMKQLIADMMQWSSVTVEQLKQEKEIPTSFGETLSWKYYTYAREHPIQKWDCPTKILYSGRDNLTGRDVVDNFCRRFSCKLTVMEDGEHWFHTEEQRDFLEKWENGNT